MSKFKLWLENFETEKYQKLKNIWEDAFKALGINGLGDDNAISQPLGRITYGQRSGMASGNFKGKKAAYKMLENAQIFTRLLSLQDPEIVKNVEDSKRWLGTNDNDPKYQNNADTTIGSLFQKIFGNYYHKLLNTDSPTADVKLNKAPQIAPKNDMGISGPSAQFSQDFSQQMPQNQLQNIG